MARLRGESTPRRLEDIRLKELASVRKKAREVALIVVRLPANRALVPDSEARHELLSRFGLTAAEQAGWLEPVELVAQTVRVFPSTTGFFIRDEHYAPSRAEVLQIAGEELERVRKETLDP